MRRRIVIEKKNHVSAPRVLQQGPLKKARLPLCNATWLIVPARDGVIARLVHENLYQKLRATRVMTALFEIIRRNLQFATQADDADFSHLSDS